MLQKKHATFSLRAVFMLFMLYLVLSYFRLLKKKLLVNLTDYFLVF